MNIIQLLFINLLGFFTAWSLILPANITQIGLSGQINIYDQTNNIIRGTGEPGATIIIQATNYLQTASSTCKYPGEYIGLGSLKYGMTNPETDPYICRPYNSCNGNVGNFIGELSNGTAKFYYYTAYPTSTTPYIVKQDAYLSQTQIDFFKSDITGLYLLENGAFVATKKPNSIGVYGNMPYPTNILITHNIVQIESHMNGFVTLDSFGRATAYGFFCMGFDAKIKFKKVFAGGYALCGGLTEDNTLIISGIGLNGNIVQLPNMNIKSIQWTYTGGRIKTSDNKIIYFGKTDTTSKEFPETLGTVQANSQGQWEYVLTGENYKQMQWINAKHLIFESVNGANRNFITVTNGLDNTTPNPTGKPTAYPTTKPTARPTTKIPSAEPTAYPSARPTAYPTAKPSAEQTAYPTARPSAEQTAYPTARPSAEQTAYPTAKPNACPTARPTPSPTVKYTSKPTVFKSGSPTINKKPQVEITYKTIYESESNKLCKTICKRECKNI